MSKIDKWIRDNKPPYLPKMWDETNHGPIDFKQLREIMMPTYLDFLNEVAQDDVEALRKAEESYGDSWKKRGGVGAFMMLARKWDRIEKQMEHVTQRYEKEDPSRLELITPKYDIFAHLVVDGKFMDGLADDIKDLRRYLMLVEAEMRARQ